jgi:hypothetical protein
LLPIQHALDRFTQVLEEMKPISDLDGVGRTAPCPLGIRARTIPTNNFNARMRQQPAFEQVRRAVWEQINGLMLL